MAKFIVYIVVFIVSAFQLNAGIEFKDLTYRQAVKYSIQENKPLFIDFYTTWCGPCKILNSEVFPNESLGEYINTEFIAIKVDAEEQASIAKKYGVSAYPTIIIAHVNEDINVRIIGKQSASSILQHAKESRDPKNTRLFELREEYNKGKRGEQFVLEYVTLLSKNNSPYKHIAKDFVESKEFNLRSKISLEIMLIAELDEKHPQMIQLLEHFDSKDEFQQKVFIELALREYDKSFKLRNIEIVKAFIDRHKTIFNLVMKKDGTVEDVLKYLGDLYRIRID